MHSEAFYPEIAPMDREVLLEVIARAVRHGLDTRKLLVIDPHQYSANLRDSWPARLTLRLGDRVYGSAHLMGQGRPLVSNVAGLVLAAGFLKRRSVRLRPEHFDRLHVRVDVLGPPLAMSLVRESEVVANLEPGEDALAMSLSGKRAMFWPDEWENVGDAAGFVRALKARVGLEAGDWPIDLRMERYSSVRIEGDLATAAPGGNILDGMVF